MQAPECRFILRNGEKCRCVARRDHIFCRHHAPHPPVRSTLPDARYSRLAHWRDLGRAVATLPPEEVPFEAYVVLEALLQDGVGGISDRKAGSLLRGLLRRHGRVPFAAPEAPPEPDAPPPSARGALPGPALAQSASSPAPGSREHLMELLARLGRAAAAGDPAALTFRAMVRDLA